MRTMVDAVAKPIASGIEKCRATAPTFLHIDHVDETVEAGPIGFSQIPRWESDATSHSIIVNPVTASHD